VKKIEICLILMLAMLFIFGVSVKTTMAQKESTDQPLTAAEREYGVDGSKEPFDSIRVIPKGPEWIGAPIMPGGKKVSEEPGRYVTAYDLPHDQVLTWYQQALKDYPDARYRDWANETYIEDQGASRWLSIKISKTGGAKTDVTIVKDNWTWIMATLFIRFTGVFVVLLVLWVALKIATLIMLRFIKQGPAAPASA
jgi:hypothetical protein